MFSFGLTVLVAMIYTHLVFPWCLDLMPIIFSPASCTWIFLVYLQTAPEISIFFKGEFFQFQNFYYVPILLVTWIYLDTLVRCWMLLMDNHNCYVKVSTASFKSELAVANLMTMYRSAMAALGRLSSTMKTSTAACMLWHPELIVIIFLWSSLSWYYCANKVLKLDHVLLDCSLICHSLQAFTQLNDAIMVWYPFQDFPVVNGVIPSIANYTMSLIFLK